VLLAASPQRALPEFSDRVTERVERAAVRRHGVVIEVAADDLPQPFALYGYRLMHAPPHLLFDRSQLRLLAVAPSLPLELEGTLAGFAADEGEAQEAKTLRFAKPAPSAPVRRIATELDQSGFDRMKRQREPLQPLAHRIQETPGVSLLFEAHDDIVGITHDDHVARSLAPSPALGPQIDDVVQVDVGKHR
jgi:hypothetical protein